MVEADFIIGDSIAAGIGSFGLGLKRDMGFYPEPDKGKSKDSKGISKVGASPQTILGYLKEIGEGSLKSKNVILSCGISNGPNDLDTWVKKEFDFLKNLNCNVFVVGCTNKPPEKFTKSPLNLVGMNDKVKKFAESYGFKFCGGFTPQADGIHPADYKAYYLNNIKPLLNGATPKPESSTNENQPTKTGQPQEPGPPPGPTPEELEAIRRKELADKQRKNSKIVNGKRYIFNVAGEFSISLNDYITPPGTIIGNQELGTFSVLELNLDENPFDSEDIEEIVYSDDEYVEDISLDEEEQLIALQLDKVTKKEIRELTLASNGQQNSVENESPPITGPITSLKWSNQSQLYENAGRLVAELGKRRRITAKTLAMGYNSSIHGLCPQGTQVVLVAMTGIKGLGTITGNADWFSFKSPGTGGGNSKFNISVNGVVYYNDKVQIRQNNGSWAGTYLTDSKQWQIGDIIAMGYVGGKPYGHIQIYTGQNWQSDFKQGAIQQRGVDSNTVALWRMNQNGLDAIKKNQGG
jgi:hypothetical protein